jgi:putative ABC transport system ATP-binding protein
MLKISHLHKVFHPGTPNETVALDDLNLTMGKGEFVTLIGGNGAGKSTLLNCIAGVFPPEAGKILIDDQEVTFKPEHKRAAYLGRVFQDPMMGTATDMSIAENMALAARRGKTRSLAWSSSKQEIAFYQDKIATLELGLENRMNTQVRLLSGGQRQALTLLMATLHRPKLLLLDEHTAALDPRTADKVLDVTKRLVKAENLTTLMITHNMRQAINFGSRLIMMNQGKIILDIRDEEKQQLDIEDLLAKFAAASGESMDNDRLLLSNC